MSPEFQFWSQTLMTIVSILLTCVIAYVGWKVAQSVRRYERLEDKTAAERDTLESELKTVATKLIEERFRHLSHEVSQDVNAMKLVMNEFRDRMREDGGLLRELGKMDQSLELKLLKELSHIKEFVLEQAASKRDLAAHQQTMETKVGELGKQLHAQNVQMARIERSCGPRGRHDGD